MIPKSRFYLPPLFDSELDVVFIGTEPGKKSSLIGHYYANPGNSFYGDLNLAGFTPIKLTPEEDEELLKYRIGLDDVYSDPDGLRARIESRPPRSVCFNGKQALERYIGYEISGAWQGSAAQKFAHFQTVHLMWGRLRQLTKST